ncbi:MULTISPECIES: hypothetical protein [unclassified Rhizobium]|uniref:hypothetical protein n=1 Tax=unclassified Rhizobium TaxID=2613769 RepID=UPI000F740654|nr:MULTISPECIES: hypothetical protein [unclassified Rhizobium]
MLDFQISGNLPGKQPCLHHYQLNEACLSKNADIERQTVLSVPRESQPGLRSEITVFLRANSMVLFLVLHPKARTKAAKGNEQTRHPPRKETP